MKGLASSCRRLNLLIKPLLFGNLAFELSSGKHQAGLLACLDIQSYLRDYITSASASYNLESLEVLSEIFSLPKLHSLRVGEFTYRVQEEDMFSELSYDSLNPGPSESFCDRSKDGTSSVTRLELFDCRAHPDGIEQILRWPKGLTEFYLEVTDNPSEFELNFGEPTELELDIASILSRHQFTLWILCLTRPERNPHRSHLCIEPDFRSFVNLQELKVCCHFLDCYGEMTQEVHPILPISLVSLKVYYDPLEDSHFLAKEKKSEEWLLGIAEHRRDVHALKRVTIHSPGDSEEWEGVLYGMAEPKVWDVPLHLAQAFKRAEIQLLVLLLTIWDNKVPFGY